MHHPRRPSSADAPPPAFQELVILPKPLAPQALPVGQLVSKTSKLNPSTIEDRDYDDIGTRWYKDVILFDTASGAFDESLGATHLIKKPEEGKEAGIIEATEERVRLLKDPAAALKKALSADEAKQWLKENSEAGFVVAARELTNASYRRARLVDRGNNNWEVARDIGGTGGDGKRRDSGLDVQTGSKTDVVGVSVRKIVVENGEATLGEELDTSFWK
ncbi:hypothetical protein P280DRAFT_16687 [Massarina eburnea CBS 473.64]|uniref:Uncharacterized protein n=1 Tax=Massarina eburnea CBS 473.64 TaxID=1395130 RepID=A0A6A6SIB2_9PLEO|nr:hypothetical protein P280DRAFT_16687 [Massarina eburnea CBS 473.64]